MDTRQYLMLTLVMITVILLTGYDPVSGSTRYYHFPWTAGTWLQH